MDNSAQPRSISVSIRAMTAPPVLPRAVRLARLRDVRVLAPDTRAIGLDPGTALVVDRLPPPLAELLDRLAVPGAVEDIATATTVATAAGVPEPVTTALLSELVGAGALVDAVRADATARAPTEATVVVHGRGPLAVGIVNGLAAAGVGRVHTVTGGSVGPGDLGTGYLHDDRGADRLEATRLALCRLLPNASTGPPPVRLVPDLAVLADETPAPEIAEGLRAAAVAHLPVRLREGVGVVGPLVLPGRTACLGCVDRHRAGRDPHWPALAAQLAGRPGRAAPGSAQATAGLAVAQVLAVLESAWLEIPPPTLGTAVELDVAAATVVRRRWPPHPDCPCRAASPGGAAHVWATSAPAGAGETIAP